MTAHIDDTAMPDGNNTNPYEGWTAPQAEQFETFFNDEAETPTAEAFSGSNDPDPQFLEQPPRPKKARDYERKVASPVRFAIKALIQNPSTMADAATLIQYGPDFCVAAGDFANENANAAKIIDFLCDGTENAALAFVAASLPIALQIMRNHEPTAEASPAREIRIPFTKRTWKMKVKVRLPWRMRMFTQDPTDMTLGVLQTPGIVEALAKQGIRIHVG